MAAVLVVAAAAKDYDRQNDDPAPVVSAVAITAAATTEVKTSHTWNLLSKILLVCAK